MGTTDDSAAVLRSRIEGARLMGTEGLTVQIASGDNRPAKADPVQEPATVLVIDDETMILEGCRGLLEHGGYRVLTARDGAEGLEIFRAEHEAIDVVIIDWIMPSMGGDEWIDHILAIDPEARIIFHTGQFIVEAVRKKIEPKVLGFLKKPTQPDQLFRVLDKALGRPQPEEDEQETSFTYGARG